MFKTSHIEISLDRVNHITAPVGSSIVGVFVENNKVFVTVSVSTDLRRGEFEVFIKSNELKDNEINDLIYLKDVKIKRNCFYVYYRNIMLP